MLQSTTHISSCVRHIVPSKTGSSTEKEPPCSSSSSSSISRKRRMAATTTTAASAGEVKRQRREREPSPAKAVTFSSLEIWDLSVRLGHHPRCRGGAALELGDDVSSVRVVPLEDYEARRAPRKTRRQMRLPRQAREELLVRCGYSIEEINRHSETNNKRRRKRAKKTVGLSSI